MVQQIGQQGWSQMTPAQRQIVAGGFPGVRRTASGRRSKSSTRARGKKSRKRASSSKRRASASKSVRKLVKGSAAAKAFMKKLRAKRGK